MEAVLVIFWLLSEQAIRVSMRAQKLRPPVVKWNLWLQRNFWSILVCMGGGTFFKVGDTSTRRENYGIFCGLNW